MTKLILTLSLILNSSVWAGTPLEDYYSKTFTKPTHGFQMEKLLTDEEQKLSNDYVNQEFMDLSKSEACKELAVEMQASTDPSVGFRSDRYKKNIAEKGTNPCDPNSVDQNVFVIDPTIDRLIPMVGQIYTMFFGVGGSEVQMVKKPEVVGKDGKKETEGKKDVCAFMPGAVEMAAQAMQQVQQRPVQQSAQNMDPATAQSESFFQLARIHEIRQKTARIQEYGWGATGVCYAGYIVAGGYTDLSAYLKMSGAVAVGAFYKIKSDRHEKWAKALKAKGEQLRTYFGSHNCDPIKEKHCYCSMASTKSDPTYCMPQKKDKRPPGKEAGPCITAQNTIDEECGCAATKSCFDYQMAADIGNLNFGNNLIKGSLNDMNKIANSGFDSGTLTSGEGGSLAMAKNFLKNNKSPETGPIALSDKQKLNANGLIGIGLPPNLAAALAKMPESNAARSFASNIKQSFGSGGALKDAKPSQEIKSSNLQFSQAKGGKGFGGNDDDDNQLANKAGNKGNTPGVETLNFAAKAQREAEITKTTGKPIFEIITHRYRTSAWKTFDVMNQPNSK